MRVLRHHYEGQGTVRPAAEVGKIFETPLHRALDPKGYRADEGLADAVNVALLLGKPLLLTGDPGTGKTQLAYSVAWELGLGEPLRFDTKSTSKSKDLFYTYDAIGRFHAKQEGGVAKPALSYIAYQCLGKALILANDESTVRDVLPEGFVHPGKRRSVVLIDEVDKAPRDFPNDLLAELEEMYFQIQELDNRRISADPSLKPIVIITSNSEKHLPDAFLRRCIYYDIPFPERTRLEDILAARLGSIADPTSPFIQDALKLFEHLRKDNSGLRKKPSTDELLAWLLTLKSIAPNDATNPLADVPNAAKRTVSVLVKTRDDQEAAMKIVDAWYRGRGAGA